MNVTFLYSNGKTFTAKNVVENSVELIRVRRKGLPDLVTLKYQQEKFIDSDVIEGIVNELLSVGSAAADGISQSFSSCDILGGVSGQVSFTIPATENGLLYLLVTPSEYDDQFAPSCGISDYGLNPVTVIPVVDRKIDPLVLADCIACMI